MTTDQAFEGPAAFAELVRAREAAPRELVELCLARIEALEPTLNAFRVTTADQALAEADAIETRDAPLAGVPVAIKDDLPVAGQPLTKGSRSYGPPEPADAEAIRRLRAAGAIPIGITNVPELTIWPWTASAANGITRNPWDPARTPGGSSGGSAAAVASGMVPAAIGTDGGGSIRIPAACCGLVGMKPTRDLVPTWPTDSPWLGLGVYGGLARSVSDSALLLDVLAGTGTSYRDAAAQAPGTLRVGLSRKVAPGLIVRLSAEQRDAWERIGRLLSELGHEVLERDPAYGLAALEFTETWVRGIYEESLTVPDRSLLEPLSRRMATIGRLAVPEWRRARLPRRRRARTRRVLALWGRIDVLLTPGLARTAIAAEGGFGRSLAYAFNLAADFTPWTPLANFTGQPAIAIPAGFSSDGLPLSVQLIGRPGAERTLFALAAQIEHAQPWAARRPAVC